MNKSIGQLIKEHLPSHKFANLTPNNEFKDWYVVFDGAGGLSCVKFNENNISLNSIEIYGGWIKEYAICDILAMKFYESYLTENPHLLNDKDVILDFLKYFD